MKSHAEALKAFHGRLTALLILRRAVFWATGWFFFWGVVVLAARYSRLATPDQLLYGLLGAIPLAVIAGVCEYRRRVKFSQIRAAYDGFNHCGGVVMAEEEQDMSAWKSVLPKPAMPALRWRGGKAVGLFAASTLFVVVTLILPERLTHAGQRPLEIGKLVEELEAEVEVLKEERILEPERADELQKQLDRIRKNALAMDPNKTWEALDHIKEANTDVAKQAAEEAVKKTANLTEAETLASALQSALELGLGKDTATAAAKDLASMLTAAKLEEGLLDASISPELLVQFEALNREDLERLLSAIQFNKADLSRTLTNLANLKLIDPKMLGQCQNVGTCPNPDALAAFLCNSTNACDFAGLAMSYCRGGLTRGRGDAPMTWKDETAEQGVKFKEEALPPSVVLSDAQLVGVTRAAPQLSNEEVAAGHGALASASAGGGAAHSRVVLPRHKQTVQRFFKRDE